MDKKELIERTLMSIIGVIICGISVGIFRVAALGVDPFQSLMSALNVVIPISFGTLYVIVNIIFLLFSLLFDKSKIGLATIINLTLLGYIAEYSETFIKNILGPISLFIRFILLIVAIIIICFASAIYFNANLGVSTYDAVSLIISEKQNKVKFKYCRIISDSCCVLIALILFRISNYSWLEITAWIGIATIITAFFMGPLISFFSKLLPYSNRAIN